MVTVTRVKVPQPTASPFLSACQKTQTSDTLSDCVAQIGAKQPERPSRPAGSARRVLNNAKIMSSFVRPSPAVAPGSRVVPSRPVRSNRATFGKPLRGRDSPTVPGATPSGAGEMDLVPPVSREDSFDQAREAIASVCAKRAKKAGKKVRKSSGKALAQLRVAVELPLAADTSVAVAAMVNGACGGGIVGTAVYGNPDAAAYASSKSDGKVEHVSIDQALSSDGCDLARGDGAVALVGVPEDQIGAARRIAELSGARPVVAVNVEWEHAGDGGVTFRTSRGDGADKATADEVFANSFSVVYSYLPLAIQGLMGATQEGAVFKCVRGGAPEGSPWRILVKDDKGAYQQVGAMQRRPEQEDLESALYNAAAAQSPVNKGIGVFKGLADKAKDSIPNPFAGLGGGDKK